MTRYPNFKRSLFALLTVTLWWPSLSHGKIRVAIDAGHGGGDKGAIQASVFESKVALQISRKLYRRLRDDPQLRPVMIRDGNQDVSLPARVYKAAKTGSQLFISIHANSSPNPKAEGTEFYILSQMNPEEEVLFLANRENDLAAKAKAQKLGQEKTNSNVQNILFDLKKNHRILDSYQLSLHLNRAWGSGNRIRQGPFYVLSQNKIPAVLVEVGYLSNSKERKKLLDSKYQDQLVNKVHRGLKAALKGSTSERLIR